MASQRSELEVTAQRAAEMQREGAQIVDVREPSEHEEGHIAGDRLIPLGDLTGAAGTIDRDRPVVFVCRVGGRSAMAAQAFRGAGYDAWSLAGGLLDWEAGGLPLEPEDGRVADH
ncbi:rhodanese-like domain-containing protein [Capillimicrobium parvum]|uniref:Sulfurtransferase n=1 Tax=Capillimicrobium parvum TaxID=2884022 RepID=A0A9E6XVD4_9ACTN|nr:rhodanese-like domain-containing protein [Capillimicrobium parvum]UGS34885.1 Sulfurtransferase [Capillimicrobium parvum]